MYASRLRFTSGIRNQTIPAGELITAYEKSKQQRNVARRCISLLILGMVLTWALLLWSAFTDFRSRLPEFISALGQEASDLSPKMSKDLEAMVTRLYPRYTSAFQNMIERDTPVIEKEAKKQLAQLDAYAKDKWPLIEGGLANIAVASEDAVREEFAKILTEPDMKNIGVYDALGMMLWIIGLIWVKPKPHWRRKPRS